MTTAMKKIYKYILAAACIAGLILAGCEEPDGTCNLVWTLSWITVTALSALGLRKLEGTR